MTPTATFHLHLDTCSQCATQPDNLCRTGYGYLFAALALDGPVETTEVGEMQGGDSHTRPVGAVHDASPCYGAISEFSVK